jgi:hypothetical protein
MHVAFASEAASTSKHGYEMLQELGRGSFAIISLAQSKDLAPNRFEAVS